MKVKCPSCSVPTPGENLDLETGWAKCSACGEAFSLSKVVPGFQVPGSGEAVPFERPLDARALAERSPHELLIHVPAAGMREPTWFGLGFATFWLLILAFCTASVLSSLPFWLAGLAAFIFVGMVIWAAGSTKTVRLDAREMVTQTCLFPHYLEALWSSMQFLLELHVDSQEMLTQGGYLPCSRTKRVDREQVRYARPYLPTGRPRQAGDGAHLSMGFTPYGVEILYEKGSFVLPAESVEEQRWLVFEINDFLRALPPSGQENEPVSRTTSPV